VRQGENTHKIRVATYGGQSVRPLLSGRPRLLLLVVGHHSHKAGLRSHSVPRQR